MNRVVLTFIVTAGVFLLQADVSWANDTFFNCYSRSIVKISVSGRAPSGKTAMSREGSGVIISSTRETFILTARHVIGSSALNQQDNSDWYVEGNLLERTIKVEGLDRHQVLSILDGDATVKLDDVEADIAVIAIAPSGFEVAKIPNWRLEGGQKLEVMLLGFEEGKRNLSLPYQQGGGALDSAKRFVSVSRARPGESGGAWIETRTGFVIAIASHLDNKNGSPLFVSASIENVYELIKRFVGPTTFESCLEKGFPPDIDDPPVGVRRVYDGRPVGIRADCKAALENWKGLPARGAFAAGPFGECGFSYGARDLKTARQNALRRCLITRGRSCEVLWEK